MAENTADRAYNKGKEYERIYRGCSQCVIAAIQDVFEIRNDDIFKAATGLAAGGGATTDGSCGAYSGAIMVLSSLLGRERDDFADPSKVNLKNFILVRKLHDKFIQEYGSVVCRDVQRKVFGRSYYLVDADEFQKFEKAGAHDIHCPEVVGKAARWAAEIINEAALVQKHE
jgi:C_GCAxxG_C_C family probable redox protein